MKSQRGLFAKASILHYNLYWYVKFICISLWRHLCIVNLVYNGDIATKGWVLKKGFFKYLSLKGAGIQNSWRTMTFAKN